MILKNCVHERYKLSWCDGTSAWQCREFVIGVVFAMFTFYI